MSRYYSSILNVLSPSFTNTYSLAFDGVDDFVSCGDSDNLSFGDGSTDSPFTISTWVKMTDATTFRIVTKYDTSAKEYFFATDSTDKVLFRLYDDSTGGILGRKYNTALTSFQGQWIHLVATYDGSGNNSGLKIYLNGTQVDNANVNSGSYTAMENTTQPLEIGKLTTTNANGYIDETAIFSSELTSANVTSIYNSGVPNDLTSLNPTAWYRNGDNGSYKSPQWLIPENSNVANSRISNYSLQLDGVDDKVDVGNPASLQITGDMTLSAWFNTSSSSNQTIIGKDSINSGTRSFLLLVISGVARFTIFQSNSSSLIEGTSTVNDGNWHHVLAVNDGTDLKIYVDGVLEGTNSGGGGTIDNGTSDFNIGSRDASHQSIRFNGTIDEVAVWNSDQSANVASIYNSGVPTTITGAVAHWKMGEQATFSTNWTVPDQVGSSDGTSANMTIEDRVGNASSSTSNAISFNMTESDRETNVPS